MEEILKQVVLEIPGRMSARLAKETDPATIKYILVHAVNDALKRGRRAMMGPRKRS